MNELNNIPIYEVDIKEGDQIELISMVETPAIERNFIAFDSQLQFFSEEDKQIIVSPVLIPNQLIYRRDKQMGEFYAMFTEEKIKKIRYQYSKDLNYNKTNINHSGYSSDKVVMIESWIKESDKDKSEMYGFSDLPVGTWFVSYKVEDKQLWSDIKAGKINGLSIEGYLSYKMKMSLDNRKTETIKDIISYILKS